MKSGPIILLEDDADDQDIFEEVLKELQIPNRLIWFTDADEAFVYLKKTADQPFIIFSDVNIPRKNGVEFKRQIDNDPDLRKKSIPFVFYSTAADQPTINEVYTEMTVQGFFKKSNSFAESVKHIGFILEYWKICKHPNTF
jgi:CheY-like chemotaxis protein